MRDCKEDMLWDCIGNVLIVVSDGECKIIIIYEYYVLNYDQTFIIIIKITYIALYIAICIPIKFLF